MHAPMETNIGPASGTAETRRSPLAARRLLNGMVIQLRPIVTRPTKAISPLWGYRTLCSHGIGPVARHTRSSYQ